MKGIIFTEFVEMVEARYGLEVLDRVIVSANPPSGGAYTAVGTYDYGEMIALVGELGRLTDTPTAELERAFGEYLFARFPQHYPFLFEKETDAFGMLQQIDQYIHAEVHKLYPDAELPRVVCEWIDADTLRVRYSSHRPFGDVAEGLVRGCLAFYNTPMQLVRRNVHGADGAWTSVELELKRPD